MKVPTLGDSTSFLLEVPSNGPHQRILCGRALWNHYPRDGRQKRYTTMNSSKTPRSRHVGESSSNGGEAPQNLLSESTGDPTTHATRGDVGTSTLDWEGPGRLTSRMCRHVDSCGPRDPGNLGSDGRVSAVFGVVLEVRSAQSRGDTESKKKWLSVSRKQT